MNPSGHTLLILEDDDVLRGAMKFDFERAGFRVLEAASGVTALDILLREPVDLVLSDIQVPDGSGVRLLEQGRKLSSRPFRFVFVTGWSDRPDEEYIALGASRVFTKPFCRKELLQCVKDLLQSPN